MVLRRLDFTLNTKRERYESESFGMWPFKYRLLVSDHHEKDDDREWYIKIQRRTPFSTDAYSTTTKFELKSSGDEFIDRIK